MVSLGLLGSLQLAAWALLLLDGRITRPNPDWAWGSNVLGSAALLWLMLALRFVLPRFATPRGVEHAARLWAVAAPVAALVLVEWLHDGPAMFAGRGTAIAALVFAAMMGAILALCGRGRVAQIAVAALWWLLALASAFKAAFRGPPLVPWDLYALGTGLEVAAGYSPRVTVEMAGSGLGLALYGMVCWKYPVRLRGLGKRAAVLALSLCALGGIGAALLFPSFPLYVDISTDNWELPVVYKREGFATALIVNCKQLIIPRPEGYDPERVREVLSEAEASAPPAAMAEPPVNILVVMNESFADLQALVPFATNRPVLPNLRALQEQGIRGRLNVSVFGGGTSATEFEMLTGNTAAFLPAESSAFVQYVQPSRNNGFSLAWQLKAQGYATVAVHPAEPSNWSRDRAYPLLGFDRFLSLRDMPGWSDPADNPRGMYSDAALYRELLRLLQEKPKGQRLFIHCVTMQNHGGYTQPPLTGVEPRIVRAGAPDEEIDNYLTLAGLSDRALGEFARALEQMGEPTLVLFFGDHQPTVSRPLTRQAEGADRWDAEPEVRATLYETPLLLWSNRGLPALDIGDTSPQYLGGLLLRVAGLPLSGYQRFLSALGEQWPVFTAQAARDISGAFYTPEEAVRSSPALREYQAAQYNLLFDDRRKATELY